MAYSFNGSTDLIDYGAPSYVNNLSTATVHVIAAVNALPAANNGRFITKGPNTYIAPTGYMYLDRIFTTTTLTATDSLSFGTPPTAFATITGTHDGGTIAGTSAELFFNGSEVTYSALVNGAGSLSDNSSTNLCIGNVASAIRGLNGKVCEAAIWNVVLNSSEIASLGKGFKPSRIRPQSLVFYAPLVRNSYDVRNATTASVSGATVADHPRVY